MSVKTVTRSTAYYGDDTHGSFELPFTGDFYQERLHVSADGLTAILGMLCVDDSPEDPFEACCDEGEFVQFDPHYIHYAARPEMDDFKRIIRANPGRVVTHNGTGDWHGPGTTKCYVTAGPFSVADTRDIKSQKGRPVTSAAEIALGKAGGYYIVPEDATNPAEYAKGMLESYSAFCNGEVYGVLVWKYTRPDVDSEWELTDRDNECWGFVGADYAEGELTEQFDAAVKQLG